jgi:hypothetical protein
MSRQSRCSWAIGLSESQVAEPRRFGLTRRRELIGNIHRCSRSLTRSRAEAPPSRAVFGVGQIKATPWGTLRPPQQPASAHRRRSQDGWSDRQPRHSIANPVRLQRDHNPASYITTAPKDPRGARIADTVGAAKTLRQSVMALVQALPTAQKRALDPGQRSQGFARGLACRVRREPMIRKGAAGRRH